MLTQCSLYTCNSYKCDSTNDGVIELNGADVSIINPHCFNFLPKGAAQQVAYLCVTVFSKIWNDLLYDTSSNIACVNWTGLHCKVYKKTKLLNKTNDSISITASTIEVYNSS